MKPDPQKMEDAVLALLHLTSFQDGPCQRAWKGHDWEIMDRLYQAGYISDPKSKAKSVTFTDQGHAKSKALFEQLFC